MLLHDAEGRARDASADAERRGQPLGEGGLAGAEIALEANDIARLQLGGEASRQRPGLLDARDLKGTRHP